MRLEWLLGDSLDNFPARRFLNFCLQQIITGMTSDAEA
jgi:hypothetical protein